MKVLKTVADKDLIEYAKKYAVNNNLVTRNELESYPCHYIDWDKAVEEFKLYFRRIKIDGEVYWIEKPEVAEDYEPID